MYTLLVEDYFMYTWVWSFETEFENFDAFLFECALTSECNVTGTGNGRLQKQESRQYAEQRTLLCSAGVGLNVRYVSADENKNYALFLVTVYWCDWCDSHNK
jgi:hypothetical protein